MRNQLVSILALLLVIVGVQTAKALPSDLNYTLVANYSQTTSDGFSLWDGHSMMEYTTDGNGWIHIENAAQLARYARNLYDDVSYGNKNIYLDCNIDLGGHTFSISRDGGHYFGTGSDDVCFDGRNHIIRNGEASSTETSLFSTSAVGLFALIKGARIQNLVVDNYTINVLSWDTGGIICGYADICTNRPNSVISNCRVMNSSVTGDIDYAGGIIGYGACDIYDCAVINSTIRTLDDTAGGIAGGINTLEINKTKISGNRVINCSVTAKDDHAGGLIGFIQANLTIEKNYVQNSTVEIIDGDYVGGLVGRMVSAGTEGYYSFTICKNWVDATVSGNNSAVKGAFIGKYDIHNTITNVAYSNYWNQSKCNLDAVGNDGTNAQTYEGMTAQQMTNEMYISGFTKWAHVYPMQPDQTTSDIVVTTAAQLREISDRVKKGYTYEGRTIRLAADINVSNGDVNWEPIGCASADGKQIHPFMGRFDGQGHTISGLTTTGTSYDYRGLFGLVINAHISNVQIYGPNISTNGKYVGGAVGWVYGGSCYVGQVMVNNATITARSSAGGVMGRSSDDAYSTIEDCQVLGTVRASQDDGDTGADGWSGGIVGNMHYGQITDCGSTASIYGKKTGLVGGCEHAIAITRSYARFYTEATLVGYVKEGASCTCTDCPTEAPEEATASVVESMKSKLGTENWYYFRNVNWHPIPLALKIYVADEGIVVYNGVVYEPVIQNASLVGYEVIGYQGVGGDVTIPNVVGEGNTPVTYVYGKTFKDNETITSIIIGNNVEAVSFTDMPNLLSITFGEKVGKKTNQYSDYERNMIRNCPKLTTFSVAAGNPYLKVDDGMLYRKKGTVTGGYNEVWQLLRCPVNKEGVLTLPASIDDVVLETVGYLAFEDCNLLTSITMPASLREDNWTPKSPFKNNPALQTLNMRACDNWRQDKSWYTNREADSYGFFGNVPENTLIYLPDGHHLLYPEYGHNVIFGESAAEDVITLNSDIATFSPFYDLNFTGSELKAYIAAGYNKEENAVLLVRVYDVPANTGLVVKGKKDETYRVLYGTSQSYYVNLLKAHATDDPVPVTEGDYNNYVLQKNGDVYSWNRRDTGTMPLGVKKAYLQLPSSFVSAAARELRLAFEDDMTTDIRDFILFDQDKQSNDRIYNLSGQQVKTMQKGVYIVNGRKVLK